MCFVATILLATFFAGGSFAAGPQNPQKFTAEQFAFFEAKVRPVLIEHCIKCHGPAKQKSDLRLDSRSALLVGGNEGPSIKLGNPDQSILIQAIRHSGELKMPAKKKLPANSIADLAAWVKMGAPWPKANGTTKPAVPTGDQFTHARQNHWAYQPIVKPQPPELATGSLKYARTQLDGFIAKKLADKGLVASPLADRRILIRRAYFDLIGLPPTYNQVESFVNDKAADDEAWSKLIDELLAKPQYGERWGRHWLDVARYADTKGYIGVGREIRYPFAYTYRDYVIRAFNEDKPFNHFIIEQIAADRLQATNKLPDKRDLAAMGFLTVGRRFINNTQEVIDDRIDVVTRGFLGLTVSCARCHDHKYDAITMADYYGLYGIFESSTEPSDADLPTIGEPKPSPQYDAYKRELAKREANIARYINTVHTKLPIEMRSRNTVYLQEVLRNDSRFKSVHNKLPPYKPALTRKRVVQKWDSWLDKTANRHHPIASPFHWFAKLPAKDFPQQAAALVKRFNELEKSRGKINPRMRQAFEKNAPKSMADVVKTMGNVLDQINQQWIAAIKANAKLKLFPDAADEQLRRFMYIADSTGPYHYPHDQTTSYFTRAERDKYRKLESQVNAHRVTSPAAPPRAMVMLDRSTPSRPHIFVRGNRFRHGKQVDRRFLRVLSQVDGGKVYTNTTGSGRLELAQAIASPDNPLTARVLINRAWHHHFGQGLVATNSDFGIRSTPPVQNELLDYLAATFIADGWSIKRLHKRIMMSHTYRQQSNHRENAYARDPENQLLWRFNRQRLAFEPMRDSLLAVAGRLNQTIGGKPVKLTSNPSTTRRTVYGFIDRQNLPNLFRTFDLAVPEGTSPKRPNTTSPQQALFMMNSPFMLEQVRYATSHALKIATDAGKSAVAVDAKNILRHRVTLLYRNILSRDPSTDELHTAAAFINSLKPPKINNNNNYRHAWQYGYGRFDAKTNKLHSFTHLPLWTGNSWQGGSRIPDPKLQWLFFKDDEAHVGIDHNHASVRRWVSPIDGVVRIDGKVKHLTEQGDGVRATIISSRGGLHGQYVAHNNDETTHVGGIPVKKSDTIDFVTDCRKEHTHDSYYWSPVITLLDEQGKLTKTKWNAKIDFGKQQPVNPGSLSAWQQLTLALMMSNEFAFMD